MGVEATAKGSETRAVFMLFREGTQCLQVLKSSLQPLYCSCRSARLAPLFLCECTATWGRDKYSYSGIVKRAALHDLGGAGGRSSSQSQPGSVSAGLLLCRVTTAPGSSRVDQSQRLARP